MKSIEKEFTPYEEALALKELGFDEPCFGRIYADGGSEQLGYPYKNSDSIGVVTSCSAPLYQQAFGFFRDNHNLSGFAFPFGEGLFDFRIYSTKEGEHLFSSPEFTTTEKAELACLKRLIQIVKSKEL